MKGHSRGFPIIIIGSLAGVEYAHVVARFIHALGLLSILIPRETWDRIGMSMCPGGEIGIHARLRT